MDTLNSDQERQRRYWRSKLRSERRALSKKQQHHAANSLCSLLSRSGLLNHARHIALYWPSDGEIDPRPFAAQAQTLGKHCYLPVLHPILHNRLWFVAISEHSPLSANRFGIPEPDWRTNGTRPAWALDTILMPLVGFAPDGSRLGMGGGFYDRTLAFAQPGGWRRPRLIGLAHDFQRIPTFPNAPWDVPLDAIATDKAIYPARP